jgi:hypothetical protein
MGLRPVFFGPRIRISYTGATNTRVCGFVKESRMKFPNAKNSTGNPEYASANEGHPSSFLRVVRNLRFGIGSGGIPHLAKNERDAGHPAFH